MAKVLVTGGAGFIGSHLVRGLLERGDRVRVLDDLSSGFEANLEGLGVELMVGDIGDEQTVHHAIAGVCMVYHLAAFISVPGSVNDPGVCYETNVMGSLNILRAAQQAGVRRVVLASSAAVYGERDEIVFESDAPIPVSPYAASKLAMEQLAQMYARAYGLETVCLRFFNVFGSCQSPDSPYAAAIPRFTQDLIDKNQVTILGDGTQTRDFVYIDDIVQGILKASEAEGVASEVFNLAGGKSISILELVDILHRFFPEAVKPKYGPAREGDIRFSQADISKASKALGYHPRIDLQEGLRITVEWFRSRKEVVS
ncbi:MAG TPA: NAD-dependent epimerase/dehydratase family protein [Anaerolineales bacterium]|nr:NAD-dependent epimerase/dehydratase family protein [Anaerolineales bacterium]